MRPMIKIAGLVLALAGLSNTASAGMEAFHDGPVFEKYGKVATIDTSRPLPKRAKFKVSFDTAKAAKPGEINRSFDSLARFINMHVEAGVPLKRIDLAMVVHGKAAHDVTIASHYSDIYEGQENANAALIQALSEKGVKFYLCGQSAAYYGVEKSELLPGVEMSISAMTSHALLQQDGYTLNPF